MSGYRDDRDALALQVRVLERENEELRQKLDVERNRHQRTIDERDEGRRTASRRACVLCGGSLLPVALFSGHDARSPTPLRISTLRFGSPGGGFTHSAPYRTLACASCGFIHGFLDFDDEPGAGEDLDGVGVPRPGAFRDEPGAAARTPEPRESAALVDPSPDVPDAED